MENKSYKKCSKKLKYPLSNSKSEIESGVKILSNVKLCPPIALPVLENEAKDDSNDSDYEIFPNPKRKRIQREPSAGLAT
ncbi:unnamed protein product [Arctia plantaginis]|uniref:Uncharacterized protein n=1 Tax=Arctia plantaginis TaxID=874455 RepID=A0A8S0YTR0_ARCPL|nr:unnamed protein product [Arctia plantaginis]CAB3231946.1 unnamed protein product [Arctia plantaginis]